MIRSLHFVREDICLVHRLCERNRSFLSGERGNLIDYTSYVDQTDSEDGYFKEQPYTKSSDRSFQLLFNPSINLIFFILDPALICFSL
jgi:hypothetical protein